MYLIPKNLQDMSSVHHDNIFQFFEWSLPSPQTFNQELDVWKQMWHDVVDDAPDTLQTSLAACEQKLFPNIFLCLCLLMVVPVSTPATERSHSGLQIVKTKLQSTMGQQRLNALMLLYIHKDVQIQRLLTFMQTDTQEGCCSKIHWLKNKKKNRNQCREVKLICSIIVESKITFII